MDLGHEDRWDKGIIIYSITVVRLLSSLTQAYDEITYMYNQITLKIP